MKNNYSRNIVSQSSEQLIDLIISNKNMIENSLKMRAMAYLSQVKANLLNETILELNEHKKIAVNYAVNLKDKNIILRKQKILIEKQNEKLLNQVELEKQINLHKEELLIQKSKMAVMGEMIENIAHQWRQPLSVITTSSSGLKLQHEMNVLTDEKLIDGLDNISKSSKYLSETIDDFRNFFSKSKLLSTFTTTSLIDTTLHLINYQFSNQNIDIISNIEEIEFTSLKNELIQVLINILNNSKDELTKLDLMKKLIFINLSKKNNDIIIQIKDNAGGINEDILDKIFDRYFTTKSENQGTGVGLSMTKDIVLNNLKGSIIAENINVEYSGSIYKGAQFTITLPL